MIFRQMTVSLSRATVYKKASGTPSLLHMHANLLTRSQLEQFSRDGFLALPSLLQPSDIHEARALLDPLFARYQELPSEITRDVGSATAGDSSVRSAEINRPTLLDGRLKQSRVFRNCRAIAAQVIGPTAAYAFDHAIYKAPNNQSETPWHQDHAYTGQRRPFRTVHFWVPLQDVSLENGCMHFLPSSHRQGFRQHARKMNEHVLAAADIDPANAIVCPLPIGGMTMHSPLTLHYTGPNRTSVVRGAWILHFGPWGRAAKFSPLRLAERFGVHEIS
jgi:ectoine hydroxylase-related dioxygenase (phytanoyl-CoA dioxygenase family)